MVDKCEGRAKAFDEAVAERFFPDSNEPLKRSKNVRLGLGPSGYQLVSEEFRFTDIGEILYERRKDIGELYKRFARHILIELYWLKVIQVIEDLQPETSRSTTADNVKGELRTQYDTDYQCCRRAISAHPPRRGLGGLSKQRFAG
jgi:hypothetical protein